MTRRRYVNALDRMTADDECFDDLVRELMADVRHHIREEEKTFPKVRDAMTDSGLREMGEP